MSNKETEEENEPDDNAKAFETIAIKSIADDKAELANALEGLDLPTLAQDANDEAIELYEQAKGNTHDDEDDEED